MIRSSLDDGAGVTQAVKHAYDLGATAYGGEWSTPYPWLAAERERFRQMVPPRGRILDVGCNAGTDSGYWHEAGFSVTGVDISGKALAIARKRFPAVEFVELGILDLARLERTFHGVWAAFSFLHLPQCNFSDGLRQVRRILEPDGVFFLGMALADRTQLEDADIGLWADTGEPVPVPLQRWSLPELRAAVADQFIPVAERTDAPFGPPGYFALLRAHH